ncbi:jg17006 [Pararge aegeria aegeria]|uniref:Jg17006 protein n=1 Tax=Pararge aegeria aegeria TaxID=348720 RepID=A0A8S4R7A8_9NEOP|nr:jg17006 [Pararge aegeria aegeria]
MLTMALGRRPTRRGRACTSSGTPCSMSMKWRVTISVDVRTPATSEEKKRPFSSGAGPRSRRRRGLGVSFPGFLREWGGARCKKRGKEALNTILSIL